MEDVFKDVSQAGPDWLKERSRGIGGSDIGVIMGTNPYKNIHELWLEKTGQVEAEDLSNNYNIIRGKSFEPVARAFAEQKYGCKFEPANFQHPSLPFCRASVDGFSDGVVLEIKCPQQKGIASARNGEIPESYYDQLQWNMLASGGHRGIYQVYDVEGEESIFIPVERNEERINELITAATKFWEHVTNKTNPVVEAEDNDFERFKEVKKQLEELEQEYESLKLKIQTVLGDNKEWRGHGLLITKSMRKGNIDYSKVPVLKGVNLEQYRKKPVEIVKIEYDT